MTKFLSKKAQLAAKKRERKCAKIKHAAVANHNEDPPSEAGPSLATQTPMPSSSVDINVEHSNTIDSDDGFLDRSLSEMMQTNPSVHQTACMDTDELRRIDAQLVAIELQIEAKDKENTSLLSQIELLEEEIDRIRRIDNEQKLSIKKLRKENDSLRKELSKHIGLMRFTSSSSSARDSDKGDESREQQCLADMQEELGLTRAKLTSLQEHIVHTASTLLSAVDHKDNPASSYDEAPTGGISPTDEEGGFQTVQRRKPRKQPADARPTGSGQDSSSGEHAAGAGEQSGDNSDSRAAEDGMVNQIPTLINMRPTYASVVQHGGRVQPPASGNDHHRPSSAKQTPGTVLIGTSLLCGASEPMRKQGIDCVSYTYRGGDIPLIRSRVRQIVSSKHQPRNILFQVGGNDADKRHSDHVIPQYDSLIDVARKSCPNSDIFVSKIPPRRQNARVNRNIDAINTYLENRCKRDSKLHYIDACPSFPTDFKKDHTHFNDHGVKVYATKLAQTLTNFQTGPKHPVM